MKATCPTSSNSWWTTIFRSYYSHYFFRGVWVCLFVSSLFLSLFYGQFVSAKINRKPLYVCHCFVFFNLERKLFRIHFIIQSGLSIFSKAVLCSGNEPDSPTTRRLPPGPAPGMQGTPCTGAKFQPILWFSLWCDAENAAFWRKYLPFFQSGIPSININRKIWIYYMIPNQLSIVCIKL